MFFALVYPIQLPGQPPTVSPPIYTPPPTIGYPLPTPPGPVDPGWGVRPPVDPGYGIDAGFRPTHPIYTPGGPPVGIWPSPGVPTHPIVLPPPGEPGSPTHPIAPIPPTVDNTLPGVPGGIYVVVPGYGVVGPIHLPPPPTAEPK